MSEPVNPWLDGFAEEEEPESPGEVAQATEDDRMAKLERKHQALENKLKAKENAEKAELIRKQFLDSLPESQRGLAVVGLAGPEDPESMKSRIESVQALLKTQFPDEPEDEAEEGDDAPEDKSLSAPLSAAAPPAPKAEEERWREDNYEKLVTRGDDRALLELMSENSGFVDFCLHANPDERHMDPKDWAKQHKRK